MVVGFHDLKSVVSLVHKVFEKEEKEAARKAAKASKPSSDDRGGVMKLNTAFDAAERKRKLEVEAIEKGWSAREIGIDERLEATNDKVARALQPEKEAAQLA
eukprot:380338-Prymnesium_polylepis.1